MAVDFFNLVKFGSNVYATEDNLSTGTRYITRVTGTNALQLDSHIGSLNSLSNVAYMQYSERNDVPIDVEFPLIDAAKFEAIKDVFQAAVTALTTFALEIDGDPGTFTLTAKPVAIEHDGNFQNGKLVNVKFRMLAS
jgi:hypothetical protein